MFKTAVPVVWLGLLWGKNIMCKCCKTEVLKKIFACKRDE
jgi:uncharacterized protein YlzI (FlbEa/FlbD family)